MSNLPQMPIPVPKNPNPYISPQIHYQNSPQQDNYKEFLRNALKIKNFPLDAIEDVVMLCTSKEEALLILGIPTYYKDLPISEIPMDIDESQDIILNEIPENNIKSQLIKDGVDLETAELLSQTCSSLEEAYHNLGPQTFGSVPPLKPQLPVFSYPKPQGQIPPFPLPKGPPIISGQPISSGPPILSFPAHQKFPGQYNPPPNKPFFNPKYSHPPKIPSSNLGQNSQMLPMFNYYNSSSDSEDFEYPHYSNRHGRSKPVNLSGPSENDPVAPDSKTEYFEKLKDFRMTMSEDSTVFASFSINEPVNCNPQTLKRINAEMKTLSKSVPCDSTASIFVMFDSESNYRVKFLLSGTVDTPYAHGLYLFDVLLPSNYPNVPPKVNLTTTGGGKFRFNPNLYDTGYVCLSIIGTWAGNPEEQWNPSSSTLLQVMLSIQSLVMDNDIIQKEPSFHSVPRESIENLGYQMEVKYGNLKFAMIDHLKNPPKGFETIIREHFKIKKQEILKTASDWVQEATNFKHRNYHSMQNAHISHILSSKGPGRAFQEAYNELQNLLSGLN
jgi:ubiquitin-protein ligase